MATTAVPLPPPSEEVEAIVKNALSACIPPETGFTARKVNEWVDATADACLRGLAAMSLPYKYAVACTLTQRTGSGIATASTAYWDPRRDTSQVVVWENEQLQCLVTVHALCLDIVAATAGMATAADPMAAGGEAK